MPDVHITGGYCWPTPKYRNWCAQHAFFEGKKAGETSPRKSTPRTLKAVGQQYPGVFWRLYGLGGLECGTPDAVKHAGQPQAERRGPAAGGAVRFEDTEPRRCPRPALPGVYAEARAAGGEQDEDPRSTRSPLYLKTNFCRWLVMRKGLCSRLVLSNTHCTTSPKATRLSRPGC